MNKGGYLHTPGFMRIFRYAGLFVPIALLTYGIFTLYGYITPPHYVNSESIVLISSLWAALSIFHFLIPVASDVDGMFRLTAYHLATGIYLVFISGISSPFAVCWLLLMLVSYNYFAIKGFALSTLSFVAFMVLDILLWSYGNYLVLTYDLVALATILMVGFVFLSIIKLQGTTTKDYNSAKAKAHLHRDRINTIINNLTDAVLSLDKNCNVRIYNSSSLNLLDTNNSLIGMKIDKVLPLQDKEGNPVDIVEELSKTKTVVKRDDLCYQYSDGEIIRLEITYSPIKSTFSQIKKSEIHEGYIMIMRDITKAKSLEEERDEFISVVSHELRTPITIAEGAISNAIAMIGHPNITNDMLKDTMNTAHDQTIFLANMVNDLSTLSRAERGVGNSIEEIDIKELAHKLYEKYYTSAKEKDLALDLDLSTRLGVVITSRLYLEELLQNFMTNAIKYTKKGSITIAFHRKNNVITLAVKDTGIGISKSDQTKIFNKFYRSEDYRTRETSGTGLGLYVAAKLSRKLNTKINVTSRLNHGSTFSIDMPVSKKSH